MKGAVVPILALVAAGCLSAPSPHAPVASSLPFVSTPVSKTTPGAEPVIASLSDGTLFVQGVGGEKPADGSPRNVNVNTLWRSTDAGKTWTDVTPPGLANEESFDGFLATGNGDRVYLENTAALTFELFRSDDKGATWQTLPAPKVPAAMHRNWIVPVGDSTLQVVMEAFPPAYAPFLAGAGTGAIPAQAGTPNEGLWYMRSDDRGMTWTTPTQIDATVNFAGQGNLVVSRDGKFLAVPRYTEPGTPVEAQKYANGSWYLLTSEDSGATWKRHEMFALTSELASAVEPLAIDPAGTLYFAWSQLENGTSQLRFATSRDHGGSWSEPSALTPGRAGVTQAMPWISALAGGTLGAVWYEADVRGPASKVNASWFGEFALVTGAETTSPVASVGPATAELHHGNICARGPACGPGEDRRLLDYPWLTFDATGRARAAFASTKWSNPSAFAVYAGES